MKGYLVYTYDTMPYENGEYPQAVFLDKAKAEKYISESNTQAYADKDEWQEDPSYLFGMQEIEVIA